ncbi:hypothetical protein [Pendulispora albinea]|uniref:Uncharacterized protein n=1 Tax=Pendulispora albinea TaxID=2741071 RepID=A0ABZ2LXG5_9BACT
MTLVAVAPHTRLTGVPKETARLDAYERVELVEALHRTWRTDAHAVGYLAAGFGPRQPRLTKGAVLEGLYNAQTTVFFCDIDNPRHEAWTDEMRAAAFAFDAHHLQTEGVYHTRSGRRLVQPLAEPLPVLAAEWHIRRWLLELEGRGYLVDWSCTDWTRHFRLPHVRRDGRAFTSPVVDLSRMQPISIDRADEPSPSAPRPRAPRRQGGGAAVAFSSELPERWHALVEPLARAIRQTVTQDWHACYLALGGALLGRGVPPEHLPELVHAIAVAADSVKPENHAIGARDTAGRWLDALPITGLNSLALEWPGVADTVERVTLTARGERVQALVEAPPAVPPQSLADTVAALERTLRDAPNGLSVIKAECGLGKTRSAETVAAERSAKRHLMVVDSARAPTQSKTSISVDKNSLALQVAANLRAHGVAVRRYFGALSVRRPDGTPECRYHASAGPMVAGGQSIRWEFCLGRGKEPCEFYDECSAKDGVEGPDDARVTVGTHPLLAELASAAGSTGLLVIDEPPPVLAVEKLAREDLATTARCLSAFEPLFSDALAPVVAAASAWFDAPDKMWADMSDTLDVSDAFGPDARQRHAPPILRQNVFVARRSPRYAGMLGTASRVLWALYRAVMGPAAVALEDGVISIAAPNDRLAAALRRDGSTIVTDANADIHLPSYARIIGYTPPFHHFAARDGAAVERSLHRYSGATRRNWFEHGRLVLTTGVLLAIGTVFDWAGSERFGLITFRTLEILIRGLIQPRNADVEREWKEAGQNIEILRVARLDGPDLEGRAVELGHYGATRGLDHWKELDMVATLGDPWPHLGDVRLGADFTEGDPDSMAEAMARAELEQAHGRLRTVHRTRPARAIHVGALVPGGSGWSSGQVRVERADNGRPKNLPRMLPDEARAIVEELGGVGAAVSHLGCDRSTLKRYLAGARGIPVSVAAKLKTLALNQGMGGDGSETPYREMSPLIGVSEPSLQYGLAIGVSEPSQPKKDVA